MELTKHHGLGNDFLVLVVSEGGVPDPALARAACDRHRGVGADGLLVLAPSPAGPDGARPETDVTMVLLNADGSRAEMSGNGVACLAQAALLTGIAAGPTITVSTDAGPRAVTFAAGPEPRTLRARVDMGVVLVSDAPSWAGGEVTRAATVQVGNPHLVLQLADAGRIEDREWLAALGAEANAAGDGGVDGGVNVEVVAPATRGTGIRMDVYERGVGLTDACGTGAVASAAAASRWGLVGPGGGEVAMHGGTVAVGLEAHPDAHPDGDTMVRATLTTAVTYVAAVEYPWP